MVQEHPLEVFETAGFLRLFYLCCAILAKYAHREIGQSVTCQSDSLSWCLVNHVSVFLSSPVTLDHEWVSCVLGNQEWLLGPFCRVDVLSQILHVLSVLVNHSHRDSLQFSHVLKVHWSHKVIRIILDSESTSVPERVEIGRCSVE